MIAKAGTLVALTLSVDMPTLYAMQKTSFSLIVCPMVRSRAIRMRAIIATVIAEVLSFLLLWAFLSSNNWESGSAEAVEEIEPLSEIHGRILLCHSGMTLAVCMTWFHVCLFASAHRHDWSQCYRRMTKGLAPKPRLVLLRHFRPFHGQECAVCLESLSGEGEEETTEADPPGLLRLPCQHVLHADCGYPWLLRNPSCPICRCNVDMRKVDELCVVHSAAATRALQRRKSRGIWDSSLDELEEEEHNAATEALRSDDIHSGLDGTVHEDENALHLSMIDLGEDSSQEMLPGHPSDAARPHLAASMCAEGVANINSEVSAIVADAEVAESAAEPKDSNDCPVTDDDGGQDIHL
eukprot:CAMPEP_0194517668 /NCGR_PEP_ID=MMETSP0253-20130528/50899_1 /TAXON_ID=2966 /ORGANISM="Noctiluca scintillans" /LENGTH=351 /DNA_ID=CAMNT_0039361661 /DNA_START=158 /DNA_END=1213 /DNA_ORIENTATION=-